MEPITRSEQYLASIIGEDVVLPVPQSRIEHYLNLIAQNGISPSSAGLISYDPDASYPDGSMGAGLQDQAAEVSDLKSAMTLFNGGEMTVVDGSYINKSTGALVSNNGYSYLDYYPVIPGGFVHVETFMGYSAGLAFFDKTKSTVVLTVGNDSGSENVLYAETLAVPADAAYIRVSCVKANKSSLSIVNLLADAISDGMGIALHAYNTQTVYGGAVSIPDGAGSVPVVSVVVSFPPIQSGSGDPAPNNKRDFTGHSGITLEVADSFDSESPEEFEWTFPSTIYAGTVNAKGELYVTGVIWKPTAPDAMGSLSGGKYRAKFNTPQTIKVSDTAVPLPGLYCNMYPTISANGTYTKKTGISSGGNNTSVYIYDPDLQTQAEWETFIQNNELQIVIPLASPTKYTVESMDVRTLLGNTCFWADNASVSVTYRADPALYIEQRLSVKNPCDYDGDEIAVFNKCLCVGDSLTQGVFNYYDNNSIYNYVTDTKYSYPAFLKKMTGADVVNMGVSGATSDQWYSAHSSDDLSGYDVAIVQLGVNDVVQYTTFGNTSKTAFGNIITKLKTDNPKIKIFVANIIPATYYNSAAYKAFSDALLAWLEETYENDADVIPVDIQQYGHTADSESYNLGHLSAIGYRRLAQDYKGFVSYYIAKHLSEFSEVQFIGTSYQFAH